MGNSSALPPTQKQMTYTGKSVYAPIEIREINWVTHFFPKIDPAHKGKGVLPYLDSQNRVEEHYLLVIQDVRDKAECQIQFFDKWHKFRTDYRLIKVSSMLVQNFSNIENKLLPWGETEKVSELLQRMELIWYKMLKMFMHTMVSKHWKNFHQEKPSANQDLMAIRMLEAKLAKTRKNVNLFQVRAGLPVTYGERSVDRAASLEIPPGITWQEYRVQCTQCINPTPDQQTKQNPTVEGQLEVVDQIVEQSRIRRRRIQVQSMDKRVISLDSKVEDLLNIKTRMKHGFGIYKHAFYEKMHKLTIDFTSSYTSLETCLVRRLREHQLQLATDMTFVKLQMADLVNHFKEVCDTKNGASLDILAEISRLLERKSERPGKSHEEDVAERFRKQGPKEFSGTSDPLAAE
ncbi:hypothetical protein F511_19778 [Dorcoceras hygrometricum]|uniref:Uncharacterized protein n=1 Tax=Dorcoceras hygrometricum TaxID=472368 RepID=A0A2Z7BKB4_9LAMI|nr:hypothetical protein F511_19778 [Dorcoceras hygrometricum]